MTEFECIEVVKIPKQAEVPELPLIDLGGNHDLAAAVAEIEMQPYMEWYAEQAEAVYLLSWEGSNVPKGAIVGRHTIIWTQNGLVSGVDQEGEKSDIGVYDRLESQRDGKQKMIVFYCPGIF